MSRLIRTPAGGIQVRAHQHDGGYRISDHTYAFTLGYLRSRPHGSRLTWGWAINYNDDFTGRYVDMAHAIEGLLSARDKAASPSIPEKGQ